MPVPWPAVTTLAPRFGPCRASEEERGPDRTAVKPCNPWQPDPAYERYMPFDGMSGIFIVLLCHERG